MNLSRVPQLTLIVVRLGGHTRIHGSGFLLRSLWRLGDVLWLRLFMSAEIPPSVNIGRAFGLPHGGRGVSIAAGAEIGNNCTIYPSVTIGQDGRQTPPRLGDDVVLATGARVLGDIYVGSGSHVGANSVVIRNVPPGATAFGVPARLLRQDAAAAESRPGPN